MLSEVSSRTASSTQIDVDRSIGVIQLTGIDVGPPAPGPRLSGGAHPQLSLG